MIRYISRGITLKPGDIIFTGTPQGVIQGKPKEQLRGSMSFLVIIHTAAGFDRRWVGHGKLDDDW
jgi:2-keto-4-pentenoate hydratase/2-oxohepta-3-ene-1,7-dioic acid hydratase in catechol pathway